MHLNNFISLLGLVGILFIGWLFSANRREINWHIVLWGIGIQFLIAWFLFVFPIGVTFFIWINKVIVGILNASLAGAKFVFGPLANPPGEKGSFGFILAFQAFPSIIFFSALMSILYYWRILPVVIKSFAYLFTKLMKVSGAEALCTASNIFVGVESALTVRPYLRHMTSSELCTVLAAGMATISSSMIALYVFSLKDVFPMIAAHLATASLLAAPAALAISKVLLPETEKPLTLGENIDSQIERDPNLLMAIINGATAGLKLIFGIVALLIAMLGLVALIDQVLGATGQCINGLTGWHFDWSLSSILGIIFFPLTWMLGVPPADVSAIAGLLGKRLILTEVVAYQDLAQMMAKGTLSDPRSAVIAVYALCGFAHVASMAIFTGGTAALVPEKTKEISNVALRALLAATLACLATACVAGIFYTEQTFYLMR